MAAWAVVGSSSVPVDNGSRTNSSPITSIPPVGMLEGDLVWVIADAGNPAAVITNTGTGGQVWTANAQQNSGFQSARTFYCIFNGTWSANPIWSASGGFNAFGVVMHVFRWLGLNPVTIDVVNVAQSYQNTPSNVNVSITGITTIRPNALILAFWSCTRVRTWTLQTAEWANPGAAQYRNTGGSTGESIATAYLVKVIAGATGDVVNQIGGGSSQTALMDIIAFAADPEFNPPVITGRPLSYRANEITLV